MALAMCRVIIAENLHDTAFVAKYCEGFDGFREHLRENGYTPEWAAPICGIEAETITRLAREFATTKPAMSACFKGPGYTTNSADASRTIYLLDAIKSGPMVELANAGRERVAAKLAAAAQQGVPGLMIDAASRSGADS